MTRRTSFFANFASHCGVQTEHAASRVLGGVGRRSFALVHNQHFDIVDARPHIGGVHADPNRHVIGVRRELDPRAAGKNLKRIQIK